MSVIHTGSGTVTYEAIRKAMNGQPFTMSLTDADEKRAVAEVVNQYIDTHLEACYCPERGDRFEVGVRIVGKRIVCQPLECCVSPESLPVLLRRLFEMDTDDEHVADAAMSLASDILLTLGFDECGQFVEREALGLA